MTVVVVGVVTVKVDVRVVDDVIVEVVVTVSVVVDVDVSLKKNWEIIQIKRFKYFCSLPVIVVQTTPAAIEAQSPAAPSML